MLLFLQNLKLNKMTAQKDPQILEAEKLLADTIPNYTFVVDERNLKPVLIVRDVIADTVTAFDAKPMSQRPQTIHVVPDMRYPIKKILYNVKKWRSNAITSDTIHTTPFTLVGFISLGIIGAKYCLDLCISTEDKSFHLQKIERDRIKHTFIARLFAKTKFPGTLFGIVGRWAPCQLPINTSLEFKVSTKAWHHDHDFGRDYPVYMWLLIHNTIVKNLTVTNKDELFLKIVNTVVYSIGNRDFRVGHFIGVYSNTAIGEEIGVGYFEHQHMVLLFDLILDEYYGVSLEQRKTLAVIPWQPVKFESTNINYYELMLGLNSQENRSSLIQLTMQIEQYFNVGNMLEGTVFNLVSGLDGTSILHHAYTVRTAFTHSRLDYTKDLTSLKVYEGKEFQKRTKFMEIPDDFSNISIFETAYYRTPERAEAYCSDKSNYDLSVQQVQMRELKKDVAKLIDLLKQPKKPTRHQDVTDEEARRLEPMARLFASQTQQEPVPSTSTAGITDAHLTPKKITQAARLGIHPESYGSLRSATKKKSFRNTEDTSAAASHNEGEGFDNSCRYNPDGWIQFSETDRVQPQGFTKSKDVNKINHRIDTSASFTLGVTMTCPIITKKAPATGKLTNKDYPPLRDFSTYLGREKLPDMLVVRCGASQGHFAYEPFISGLVIQSDEIDGLGIPTPNPLQVPNVEGACSTYGTIPMCVTFNALENQGLTCRKRNVIKDATAIKAGVLLTDRSGVQIRRLTKTYGMRRHYARSAGNMAIALDGGMTPKDCNWIGKEHTYLNFEHTTADGANKDKLMPPNITAPKINAWSPYRIISSNVEESTNENGMLKDTEVYYMMSPSVYFACNARYDKVPNVWSNLSLYDM